MSIDTSVADVSHTPLDQILASEDSWTRRAVLRIQAEAAEANPEAAVAAFNSQI